MIVNASCEEDRRPTDDGSSQQGNAEGDSQWDSLNAALFGGAALAARHSREDVCQASKRKNKKIKNCRSSKIQQSEYGFEYVTLVFGSDIDNSHKHAIKLQSFSYGTEKSGNSRRTDEQLAAVWTFPSLQIGFKVVWVVLQVSVLLHATIRGLTLYKSGQSHFDITQWFASTSSEAQSRVQWLEREPS